jgi:hypothetical protein
MEGFASQMPATPGAGWYPDPTGHGQRFWDGARWTEHYAPAAGAAPVQQSDDPNQVANMIGGILISVLIPIVGVIVGIVWLAKGRTQQGLIFLGISLVSILGYLALTA